MKHLQKSSKEKGTKSRNVLKSEEVRLKEEVTKYAEERKYILNKGLVMYLIYGDLQEENREMSVPKWVEKLPDGQAFQKLSTSKNIVHPKQSIINKELGVEQILEIQKYPIYWQPTLKEAAQQGESIKETYEKLKGLEGFM